MDIPKKGLMLKNPLRRVLRVLLAIEEEKIVGRGHISWHGFMHTDIFTLRCLLTHEDKVLAILERYTCVTTRVDKTYFVELKCNPYESKVAIAEATLGDVNLKLLVEGCYYSPQVLGNYLHDILYDVLVLN